MHQGTLTCWNNTWSQVAQTLADGAHGSDSSMVFIVFVQNAEGDETVRTRSVTEFERKTTKFCSCPTNLALFVVATA